MSVRFHRSKFLTALLAFVLGGIGAHRFYLGSRFAWMYGVWLVAGMALYVQFGSKAHTWILVLAGLPVWIGFAESLGFAVMPDERFDAKFNPHSARRSRNGWNCVLLAIVVLLVGTSTMMTMIILASQYWFEAQVALAR